MRACNKQLEKLVLAGAANDILLYYENYFTYLEIANEASRISESASGKFYILAQMNALNAMHLHCCRMYESKYGRYKKRTFAEIIEFLKRNRSSIEIYNTDACARFIDGVYDLRKDFKLSGSDPKPDKEFTAKFCKAIDSRLPEKGKNHRLWRLFHPIWKVRSKEIAHNDLDAVKERSTFEGLNELVENAVDIVNAITQVYFGSINMTEDLELSLVADGKSSSKALKKILGQM